jgi:2-phospho-L-lactate/phosphoenolpyruvate guanylyltransferase
MAATFALVPLKAFALAKTRLDGVLTRGECAQLAEHMARDVLRALKATPEIAGLGILGNGPGLCELAAEAGARHLPEPEGGDYRSALAAAATELTQHGTGRLLVLPGDLPTLSSAAVRALLASHREGVTVCTAARDGGTNALVLTPPDAIPFLFGPDSARRHLEAATAAGIPGRAASLPAFTRDIDTPDDLQWLLGQRIACATLAWLKASGIAARLKGIG